MKKFILILLSVSLIFTSACSVQENMSADIFFDRLSENSAELDFESYEQLVIDGKSCCFLKDLNGAEYAFEITLNENGDAEKIAVSCNITELPQSLISCLESVIKTYSPVDNSEEVISAFFENGKPKQGNSYYETQWRSYSVYATESDFFFSVSSKKIVGQSAVELSLKPNDRVDF